MTAASSSARPETGFQGVQCLAGLLDGNLGLLADVCFCEKVADLAPEAANFFTFSAKTLDLAPLVRDIATSPLDLGVDLDPYALDRRLSAALDFTRQTREVLFEGRSLRRHALKPTAVRHGLP